MSPSNIICASFFGAFWRAHRMRGIGVLCQMRILERDQVTR